LHPRRHRPTPSRAAGATPVTTRPTVADPATARAIAPGTQGEPGSPLWCPDVGGACPSTKGSALPERVGSGDGDRPGSGDGPAGPEDEVGTGVGDGDGPGVGPTEPGNEAETGVGEPGRKTPLLGAGVGAGAAGVGAGPGQAPRRGRPSRVTWVSREVELLAGSGSGWLPV